MSRLKRIHRNHWLFDALRRPEDDRGGSGTVHFVHSRPLSRDCRLLAAGCHFGKLDYRSLITFLQTGLVWTYDVRIVCVCAHILLSVF